MAGVSIGTVSNTLNTPEKVTEPTRRRVMAAIAELGFVRNDAARSLSVGTSRTIGLVVADLGNSFFVDMARGAEHAARQHGMNLLIADTDIDREREVRNLELFEQARVAGILLAPLDTALARSQSLPVRSTPVVLVNYESKRLAYSGVIVNEQRGGELAVRHLIGIGRRRLVFVGGSLSLTAVQRRLEGARKAAEGVTDVDLRVHETRGPNIPDGRTAARSLIGAGIENVDGIVAASDLIAIGVIQMLTDAGIRVPEDVAVTGYDDNHFASESAIPTTTVAQPGHEMGREAAELLIGQIADPQRPNRTVVLDPRLILRRSTLGEAWTRD